LIFGVYTQCPAAGDGEVTVYASKTGAKYHREDCKILRQTGTPLSLEDAVLKGLGPCRICNPPALSGGNTVLPGKEIAGKAGTVSGGGAGEIYRVTIAGVKKSGEADISKMLRAKVVRHIDGDTVELEFENPVPPIEKKEKIRMIGVDTPETVHPKKEVEFFGAEASNFTKKNLLGETVFIALDRDTRDKYGRLLAYIYLKDGDCFNAKLIRKGMAHCYTRFPYQFMEEFRLYEKTARERKKGLWNTRP